MAAISKRVNSIDIIRGIAIIGMVLCANIGFNSDLPAWMFHAQTPPPTHAFNPDVPGITWVDLVFPFFLFSMGAAFPLAMKKKLDNGIRKRTVAAGLVKRWIILSVFAIVLGNAYGLYATTRPTWQADIFKIALWAAMMLALINIPLKEGTTGWRRYLAPAVNLTGAVMTVMLGTIYVRWFGLTIDKGVCDVIIMILANLALWGGLIWMLTRNSLRLRWSVILFIAAVKALSSYAPETLAWVPSPGPLSWLFSWAYLQYLVIALVGSVAGDLILAHSQSGEKPVISGKDTAAGIIALAAALVQLWGLFVREVTADLIISVILCAAYFALTHKNRNICTDIARIGFILLIAGIVFDPIDGGITKDYCNLSYLFNTCGIAALTTSFLLTLELGHGVKGRFIAGVGQNPMLAYTVTNFLIGPILGLLTLLPRLYALAEGSQFWGVMQGVIITLLMAVVTYIFTRLRIFWKS